MTDKQLDADSLFKAALQIASPEEVLAFLKHACTENKDLLTEANKMLGVETSSENAPQASSTAMDQTLIQEPNRDARSDGMESGLADTFAPESAVVVGNARPSVLRSLQNTVNEVPRVLLRESETEGNDPITKPGSPEVPQSDANSRYQLQGEIARGGMGAILKGRDMDLGRDLAIKVLLDSNKDRPEVIQRFIEEAQIGGQLQHPGIAPVYELGQFADRRPFFSMKLVKGDTFAKLLADRKDPADDRGKFIGIFEQICQTMAYAHSRGVIHRDLKPANIMVGAFGEVQVMDWGLAKVLSSGGVADEKKAKHTRPDQSIIATRRSGSSIDEAPGPFASSGSDTQMGSVMGTLAYMPPEQALGEIDQLDRQADVFGLGAILCEILTGKPPYTGDDGTQVFRMASRGKLDHAFARLDDCSADMELIELTKQCLSPEPVDRPKDGGVLAAAISGYLEAVETKLRETQLATVEAQTRAEETSRRHKLAIRAGAAIAATLLIGIGVSGWQAIAASRARTLATAEAVRANDEAKRANDEATRANEEANRANGEANRAIAAEHETQETLVQVAAERDAKDRARKEAEAISTFLTEVFQSPDPVRDGRTITVAEVLDVAAEKLETDLADQPADRAKLQATLGGTYQALGLYRDAAPLQEQVRNHYLKAAGPADPNTLEAMHKLASSYMLAGRNEEALALQEKVLKLRQSVLGPEHSDTIRIMANVALSYTAVRRKDEAASMNEKVVKLARKVNGPEHPNTLRIMGNLAVSYSDVGREEEALSIRQKILGIRRKLLGSEHPDTLHTMGNLATSYYRVGRVDEAIELSQEVLALRRKVLGPEHPHTLHCMATLAYAFAAAGRNDEALATHQEVLTQRRKLLGPEHPDTLRSMWGLAVSFANAGRHNDAAKLREEMLPLFTEAYGSEHADTLEATSHLADSYFQLGRQADAIQLREKLLTIRRRVLGNKHANTIYSIRQLADSFDEANRLSEAITLREEIVTLSRELLSPQHPETLSATLNLANTSYKAGRRDDSTRLYEQLISLRPRDPVVLNQIAWHLVTVADQKGKFSSAKRAVEWARQAVELAPSNAGWLNTYGVALYRTKQWEEAIDTLQLSATGFDEPYNWLFLAMACWQMDEKTTATMWHDKSLEWKSANPDFTNANSISLSSYFKTTAELESFFLEADELMKSSSGDPTKTGNATKGADADKPEPAEAKPENASQSEVDETGVPPKSD